MRPVLLIDPSLNKQCLTLLWRWCVCQYGEMLRCGTALFVAIALLVGGCIPLPGAEKKEAELVLMGDKAPQLGSTQYPTLDKFVVGSWRIIEGAMDPDQAKQMNIPAEMTKGDEGLETFVFDPDGKVTVTQKGKSFKVTGQWQLSQDAVLIQFEALDGKPLNQAKEELQKESESGRSGAIRNEIVMDWILSDLVKLNQWRVAPDKRHLFSPMVSPTGETDPRFAMGDFLERLAPAKSQ